METLIALIAIVLEVLLAAALRAKLKAKDAVIAVHNQEHARAITNGQVGAHALEKGYARLDKQKPKHAGIVELKQELAKATANGQQLGEHAQDKVLARLVTQTPQAAHLARLKHV